MALSSWVFEELGEEFRFCNGSVESLSTNVAEANNLGVIKRSNSIVTPETKETMIND